MSSTKIAWWWVALGLVALFAISRLLPFARWITEFVTYVEGKGIAGAIIFAIGYIIATVCLFPGGLLTIAAGVAFGLFKGTVISLVSATIGAALAFLIARHLARKTVENAARRNPQFAAIDQAIGAKGWLIVFLTRLSPLVPFNLSNYFYGITQIGFWPYLGASFLGMAPGSILYVYLGKIGAATLGGPQSFTRGQYLFLAAGFLATLAGTFYITRVARDALQSARAAKKP